MGTKRGGARRGDEPRLIWRARGDGVQRAYLDARVLGKGRIALVAQGQTRATTDPETAARLAAELRSRLQGERVTAERLGLRADCALRDFADEYVGHRHEAGSHSPGWLLYLARALDRACDFFDRVQAERATTAAERRRCASPRNLATISPPDVRAWTRWLGEQPNGRGGTLGAGSVREHLAALSGVFSQAISDGRLPLGGNPVAALKDRPSAPKSGTALLEPDEVALLLESARTLDAPGMRAAGGRRPLGCGFELLAFMAYTGCREGEAQRAEVADLHFDGPMGAWISVRGTKSEASADRIVPMHPHLADILRAYFRRTGRLGGLLFRANDGESPVGDWRKTLDLIAKRAGYPAGAVRTRRLRTSYATHRCTCDGADANTVRLELGHSDLSMLANVYARAQRRSERMGAEFSYRIDRWAERPGVAEKLARMQEPAEREDREDGVVGAFLAHVDAQGWGVKRTMRETGVDRSAIQRLRAGTGSTVQHATRERMAAYLEGAGQRVA